MVVSASGTSHFTLSPFPYGEANVVPVHIIGSMSNKPLVLTIFKYSTLIVCLDPICVQGKPLMHIGGPLHSIISKKGALSLTSGMENLSPEELSWLSVYLKFAKETQTNVEAYSQQRNLRRYRPELPRKGRVARLAFDISRCKCLILSGKRPALRSFTSLLGSPYTPLTKIVNEKLSEIAETVRSIEDNQRALKKSSDRIEASMVEIKGLLVKVSDEIRSNPARIASILEQKTDMLKGILFQISVELKTMDPQNAKTAVRLRESLMQKAAHAADLVQIFQFITGIATAQMLGTTIMKGIGDLLRYVASVGA